MDYLKNKKAKVETVDTEYDLFCRSLIPKLKRLDEKAPEIAHRIQIEILKMLTDAEHVDMEK